MFFIKLALVDLGGISAFVNFHHVSSQLASFKLLWSSTYGGISFMTDLPIGN